MMSKVEGRGLWGGVDKLICCKQIRYVDFTGGGAEPFPMEVAT
jgi:hypothetical protein